MAAEEAKLTEQLDSLPINELKVSVRRLTELVPSAAEHIDRIASIAGAAPTASVDVASCIEQVLQVASKLIEIHDGCRSVLEKSNDDVQKIVQDRVSKFRVEFTAKEAQMQQQQLVLVNKLCESEQKLATTHQCWQNTVLELHQLRAEYDKVVTNGSAQIKRETSPTRSCDTKKSKRSSTYDVSSPKRLRADADGALDLSLRQMGPKREPMESPSQSYTFADMERMLAKLKSQRAGSDPAASTAQAVSVGSSDTFELLPELQRVTTSATTCAPLDTLEIAARVKSLLVQHGIGQRIFAKHVLDLSQGTVSELLSKPKEWSRLTDKSKESFRRMHVWLSSPALIERLAKFFPRKNGFYEKSPTDSITVTQSTTNTATSAAASSPTTEQRVARILNEAKHELSKTAEDSTESNIVSPLSTSTTKRNSASRGGNVDSGTTEAGEESVVRRIYCEQLMSLAWQAQLDGDTANEEIKRLADDVSSTGSISTSSTALIKSESSNEPVDCSHETIAAKLERSPSSSVGRSSSGGSGGTGRVFSRLRQVLPPVAGNDSLRFAHVDTEMVVNQVKQILQVYSVSQRSFGEAVLGLSQGSVSDLLARPRDWDSLTMKGREPFIRMALFLEDPSAILKLVSLNPTCNQTATPRAASIDSAVSTSSPTPPSPAESGYSGASQRSAHNSTSTTTTGPSRPVATAVRKAKPIDEKAFDKLQPYLDEDGKLVRLLSPPFWQDQVDRVTLDTRKVTDAVKEMLHVSGIGQRTFGESVLGLSQSTVSDLLNKPKLWQHLNVRGKEPFVRMHFWMLDAKSVQLVRDYQSYREYLFRSKIKTARDTDLSSTTPCSLVDDETKKNERSVVHTPERASNDRSAARKQRLIFSDEQKALLREAHDRDNYPSATTLQRLAEAMPGVSVKSIANWFHNHRVRSKAALNEPVVTRSPSPAVNSDAPSPFPDTLVGGFTADGLVQGCTEFSTQDNGELIRSEESNSVDGNEIENLFVETLTNGHTEQPINLTEQTEEKRSKRKPSSPRKA